MNNKNFLSNIKANKKRIIFGILTAALTALLWLLIWQIAAYRVGVEFILPSPMSVAKKLFELITKNSFFLTVASSLLRILLGFISGAIIGASFAFLGYFVSPLGIFFSPLVKVVRATPVASFILIAILWIPSNAVPIFISFLMVFPIVYLSVLTGLNETDKKLIELTRAYRFSVWKKISLLYIPSSLPYFASASVTSLGLAWKSGVAAEVLSVTKNSIGNELYLSNLYLESAELFAWTVTVIILSVGMEALIKLIARKIKQATRRSYGRNFG